jgi:hypothetical protein
VVALTEIPSSGEMLRVGRCTFDHPPARKSEPYTGSLR